MATINGVSPLGRSSLRLFTLLVWVVRIGILSLLILAACYVDFLNNARHKHAVEVGLERELSRIRVQLESVIMQNIQVVRGLTANIALEPTINQARFSELSEILMGSGVQLRNLGGAPDFVITLMHPLVGNEAAIGLDYRKNAEQWGEIQKVIERGSMMFVGPFTLVQGGEALAGRIPVYNHQSGELWGLISAIMDLDVLLQAAGIDQTLTFTLQLAQPDDTGSPKRIFYGSQKLLDSNALVSRVSILGNEWLMLAEPQQGWPSRADNAWILRIFLLLGVVVIGGSAFWISHLIIMSRIMQRRLEGLFQLSPIGIALRDIQSDQLLLVNRAFASMLNYSVDELIGKKDAELTSVATQEVNRAIGETLHQDIHFGPLEKAYCNRNGEAVPVAVNGLLLSESSGKKIVWQIIENISERKKIERMKSEFVSTVSHELRTPLTSVAGSLGIIAGGALGPLPISVQQMIDIAYKNSRRLILLINDLLDMEKLVSGNLSLHLEAINSVTLIDDTLTEVKSYADQYHVSLVLYKKVEEAMVFVDPQRYIQVLTNLLSNAIKFSPTGGAVELHLDVQETQVVVSVVDFGEGIPKEFQAKIFQKFAQADSSDTRNKGGTGLGLAISKELIERMQGKIDFESRTGKTRFFFSLPLVVGDEQA